MAANETWKLECCATSHQPLVRTLCGSFASRVLQRGFHHLGFKVADETNALMVELVKSGEMAYLVAERVWQETRKALMSASPQVYIQNAQRLRRPGRGVPRNRAPVRCPPNQKIPSRDRHREHTFYCAWRSAARQNAPEPVRLAVLLHDLGKAMTPESRLPSHVGHERAGVPLVRDVAERMKLPRVQRELAELVCRHHLRCHQAVQMRPDTLVTLLQDLDAWRRPERLADFLQACEIDIRGRTGRENDVYASRELLSELHKLTASVTIDPTSAADLDGPQTAEWIRNERVQRVRTYLSRQSNPLEPRP